MVFALVQAGLVVNTIVADQAFIDANFPGAPRIDLLPVQPGIGWSYDGAKFNPPPPPPAA